MVADRHIDHCIIVALAAGVVSHALLYGVWLVLSQRNVLRWPAVQVFTSVLVHALPSLQFAVHA